MEILNFELMIQFFMVTERIEEMVVEQFTFMCIAVPTLTFNLTIHWYVITKLVMEMEERYTCIMSTDIWLYFNLSSTNG